MPPRSVDLHLQLWGKLDLRLPEQAKFILLHQWKLIHGWIRFWSQHSAQDCARLIEIFPELDSWVSKLSASDPDWTPAARIGRAYRAGVLARLRLADQVPGLDSLSVPFRNVYYIVLRGAPGAEPCWTLKYSIYLDRVGGRDPSRNTGFAQDSISQALPSHAEASAFLAGANRPWPPQAK